MADEQQERFPISPEIGKPLARIVEQRGAEIEYSYSSALLSNFLKSGMPTFTEEHEHGVRYEPMYEIIATRAIERLGENKAHHQLVRDLVKSDEFRQQFVRDNLTITVASHIEFARILGGDAPLLKITGIAPYKFTTEEERQSHGEAVDRAVEHERSALETAYLDYIVNDYVPNFKNATPRVALLPASSFNPNGNTLPFINSPHVQAAARAMWAAERPGAWLEEEFSPPSFLDIPTGVKVYAHDSATYNPTGIEVARTVVRGLDDKTLSTLLICLGKWLIDTSGKSEHIIPTRITVADVLGYRGLEKHPHGGYSKPQKEEARAQVLACNAIWVKTPISPTSDTGGKSRPPRVRKSRLLEVSFEDQVDTFGGEIPYAFHVAPGAWALDYLGKDRKVAHVLKTVMQYNPISERLLFRLGFYYATIWRNRAHDESYADGILVSTILERSFIALPAHNPKRFISQVESAFDRLRKDGVIAAWRYERKSVLPQKRYLEAWQNWKVQVTPTRDMIERYSAIPERRQAALTRTTRARSAGQKRGKSA